MNMYFLVLFPELPPVAPGMALNKFLRYSTLTTYWR